ncbi:MAG: nucleotidyltransferase [Anaerolineales bacterium]
MYNLHKELNTFYEDHVCLKNERKTLADHRDTNLERLKTGLNELDYPNSFESKNQGSYAMHTINKHPQKDYDIDVAIIFEKDDLPANPTDARKRIEDAMNKGGGDFSKPPKAKTNAVRVYYAEGHHVDLAVYRKNTNDFGNLVIQHAGPEWTNRNPVEIADWFASSVQSQSPSKEHGAKVGDGQLRRVVRWLKMFAKSRSSWDMPCGLILSVLAVECFVASQYRDDSSLYDTMKSIRNRLASNKEVQNPVHLLQSLTGREKDKLRIEEFRRKVGMCIRRVEYLIRIGLHSRQSAARVELGV